METVKTKVLLLGLVVLSFVVSIVGITAIPFFEYDEPWYSEAAREMMQRGDWAVPFFNNTPFYDMPPFFFWCQIASFKLFGENDFAARFPSVIALILVVLLIFGFGYRLYGVKIGAWAAVIFSVSLYPVFFSRAAYTGLWTIFFVTLATWSAWELLDRSGTRLRGRSWCWWFCFYGALAFGFLTKGLVAWVPLGSVLIYARWDKKSDWVKKIGIFSGFLLTLGIIGGWALTVYNRTGWDYFNIFIGRHFIKSIITPMYGHGPRTALAYVITLPYYIFALFPSFFPWSFLLPSTALYWIRRDSYAPKEKYLLSSVFFIFIFFSLWVTKYTFFILLAFPSLALLVARGWFDSKRSARGLAILAGVALVTHLALVFFLTPIGNNYFPVPNLARQSSQWLSKDMEFASCGYKDPGLVWYFRKFVKGWHHKLNEEEIKSFMEEPGPRFCVLPAKMAKKIFPVINPEWKVVYSRGLDITRANIPDWKFFSGKTKNIVSYGWTDLTMIIKS